MDKAPVIVGVGEASDHSEDLLRALEPLALIVQAIREADQDAGGGWTEKVESIDVVNETSWGYQDLPQEISNTLKIQPKRLVYGVFGGESPIRYIHEAAIRISRGELEVALVCGGEAEETRLKAAKAKVELKNWTPEVPQLKRPVREGVIQALALRNGLSSPLVVYPIYEYASASSWGQTLEQSQAESGKVWAEYSSVASKNPHAWRKKPFTPEEIASPSPANRLVAGPYTKLMVANPTVNQAAAVLVTSYGKAKAMGVSDDKLIFIWGGTAAAELADFASRSQFARSTAMEVVLNTSRERTQNANFDAVELYSCFPCVPKMAKRVLSLPDSMTPTVTGGLSFFGGPYNNYMSHAACGMTRTLRQKGNAVGLLYGQGGFVSKHHALVVGTQPPKEEISVTYDVQEIVDRERGATSTIEETYEGNATVETYTILRGKDGEAEQAVIFAKTPKGHRTLAKIDRTDPTSLEFIVDLKRNAVGTPGKVSLDSEKAPRWTVS